MLPCALMARGRYTIERKLAAGGMAEIFLATQHGAKGFQRPVVLKRILKELGADPAFRNMLVDEAHVAMELIHSNIAQVLDLGSARGRTFLVMELVDGWDFNQLLKRAGAANVPLSPALSLHVITEVCRALSYAHHKSKNGKPLGIVHRDISPHNILISEQGEVKLTDFGIAKALIEREKTATGVMKGKVSFMAPEQAHGGPLDARSDLFSLGVTLYVAVTGLRPFAATSELETLLRVREARYEPPEKVRPQLPPEVCRVITRAMQKDPKQRYQTAEEMLLDAEGVLRGLGHAGTTELKRWVAALSAKTGLLPPSRVTSTEQPQLETEPEEISVELDDLDAAAPPPPPLDASKSVSVAIDVDEVSAPRRGRWGFVLLLVALIGLAGGAIALGFVPLPATEERAPEPVASAPTPVAVARAPVVEPVPVTVVFDAAVAEVVLDASVDSPADAAVAERAVARAEVEDAGAEPAAEDAGSAEVVVESAPEVLDAGDSEPAPVEAPLAEAREAAVKPSQADELVSVRISSEPLGAAIRIEKKTFGATPTRLRFRPGITYELTFTKDGFQPLKKLVSVTTGTNQAVNVQLSKDAKSPRR